MKTCPVCKAAVFDDMRTCFGCMYRFGSNAELEGCGALDVAAAGEECPGEANLEGDAGSEEVTHRKTDADSKTRVLREGEAGTQGESPQAARRGEEGGRSPKTGKGFAEWAIRLEIRSESNPGEVLSFELFPPATEEEGEGAPKDAPSPEMSAKLKLPLVEAGFRDGLSDACAR